VGLRARADLEGEVLLGRAGRWVAARGRPEGQGHGRGQREEGLVLGRVVAVPVGAPDETGRMWLRHFVDLDPDEDGGIGPARAVPQVSLDEFHLLGRLAHHDAGGGGPVASEGAGFEADPGLFELLLGRSQPGRIDIPAARGEGIVRVRPRRDHEGRRHREVSEDHPVFVQNGRTGSPCCKRLDCGPLDLEGEPAQVRLLGGAPLASDGHDREQRRESEQAGRGRVGAALHRPPVWGTGETSVKDVRNEAGLGNAA